MTRSSVWWCVSYDVKDVVLAVPNNCQSDILNGEEMIGRIVLVDRGEVM